MRATDFLEEWNRTHTSSPTYQDVLDWAEQKQSEEMNEQNAEWIMTLGVQKQLIIKNACNIFCYIGCPHKTDSYNCFNNKCETWEIFKRMMEE